MPGLMDLGYDERIETLAQEHRAQGFAVARVTEEHRGSYVIRGENFEIPAEVSGKVMFQAERRSDYPAVGDWVAVTTYDDDAHAVIHAILPRRTTIERKAVGKKLESQVIATNVDSVFVVQPLDQTFNARRVERLLLLAREGGAAPVILLSKKDLCPPDLFQSMRTEIESIASGLPVMAYDIASDADLEPIRAYIHHGTTFCLLGPSGAGKSSLINRLAGRELLVTGEVREYDAKGRHTTAARELIVLEQGGILIDTPGMRELGVWEVSTSMDETFDDVVALAAECAFSDCTHTHEPDCAVKLALDEGRLESARYDGFVKLLRERRWIESRQTNTGQRKRKLEAIKRQKEHNKVMKRKGKK
jgi:ribosome biogenesis GTPase